jgi:TPR repeat protein
MARFELSMGDAAAGGAIVKEALDQTPDSPEAFFRLGLMHSNGREGGTDVVVAHKWFNIAAMKGDKRAAAYRQELAEEMTREEIAQAQRAAREWLTLH